ncbi:MAG: hypothetical protein GYA67_05020 [Smithella sp.]|nr:hypothetical protein [Syntrophaceae bacterium]NMC91009.1 hypothetical protein [Smithella sp.]HNV57211.1 hypothetical protein [Smithellaceae bacterium]MBP9531713.1 hypothetical protein [Syntrophaceae bacterium]MBP9649666.1 hypothetical protein [Syntrophaceae bacterium]
MIRSGYFFAGFFLAAGFGGAFFTAGFLAAGFSFFTAVFFLGAAAAFFDSRGPLLTMSSSQQIRSAKAHPHSSSTMTESPHTSQFKTSPGFTFDICSSSSLFMSFPFRF